QLLGAMQIQRRDARHRAGGNRCVGRFAAAFDAPAQAGQIQRIAADAAVDPGFGIISHENADAGGNFPYATAADHAFVTGHADEPRYLAWGQQLNDTEADAEPAQPSRQGAGRVVGSSDLTWNAHESTSFAKEGSANPYARAWPRRCQGLSTTLMQPSCLSRNVLYISGPCSRLTLWVMTKVGSICPS